MLKDGRSPSSILEEHEDERRWESSQRRHRFLTAALIVLIGVIAALAWFAYPILSNHGAVVARLSAVEPLVSTLGGELKNAESKLADLSKNHEDLRQQMDKFGQEMRARFELAKKQSGDATAAMMHRIESEIDEQMSGLRIRVATLESSRDGDQLRIAGLQQNMNKVLAEVTV